MKYFLLTKKGLFSLFLLLFWAIITFAPDAMPHLIKTVGQGTSANWDTFFVLLWTVFVLFFGFVIGYQYRMWKQHVK